MNNQVKKIVVKSKIRKPFIVRDKKDAVFRKGCGPVISGYWG